MIARNRIEILRYGVRKFVFCLPDQGSRQRKQSIAQTQRILLWKPYQMNWVTRFYTRLSGTHLVWGQGHDSTSGDVWAHDLSTEYTWNLTDHEADQFMPRIDGTRVVWTDNRNGPGGFVNADIYVHDFSTGDTTRADRRGVDSDEAGHQREHSGLRGLPRLRGPQQPGELRRDGHLDGGHLDGRADAGSRASPVPRATRR